MSTMDPDEVVNRLMDILFWFNPDGVRRWLDLHRGDLGKRGGRPT